MRRSRFWSRIFEFVGLYLQELSGFDENPKKNREKVREVWKNCLKIAIQRVKLKPVRTRKWPVQARVE